MHAAGATFSRSHGYQVVCGIPCWAGYHPVVGYHATNRNGPYASTHRRHAPAYSCCATQRGVAAAVVPIASCSVPHHAPRAAATLPQTRSSFPSAPAACSTRRSSAPPRRMPPRTPATPSRTTYTWRTTCNVHLPRDMHRATYNETLMGGGGGVSQGSPGKAAPRNTRLEGSSGA